MLIIVLELDRSTLDKGFLGDPGGHTRVEAISIPEIPTWADAYESSDPRPTGKPVPAVAGHPGNLLLPRAQPWRQRKGKTANRPFSAESKSRNLRST